MITRLAMSTVIDGRAIAQRLREALRQELSQRSAKPTLAILSFANETSRLYHGAQVREATALGIRVVNPDGGPLPTSVSSGDVEALIRRWNQDPGIHGIFAHQPVPPQLDAQALSTWIAPEKDIEGIHPQNSARRFFAKARIGSCTALAVMELIDSTGVNLEGKETVVVGHSEIVGRPVSMLLLDRLATTTICHVATNTAHRLEEHVRRAEVLVVAVGRPHFIQGNWIKSGAIVIDVGINLHQGKVVGDVDFEAAKSRAGFISPVPGGVGPVTVMLVMKNTLEAFKLQGMD